MYTAFASVYDQLMVDVDYQSWAQFYHFLMESAGIGRGKVCECACGTGSITIPLTKYGYQMTGVDLSAEMLFAAAQKGRKHGVAIPFVKQNMCQLRLHREMDAVMATNDGLNYLKGEAEVMAFFTSAYNTLRLGGALVMDISTPYKLQHILGNYFIGDETETISYLWQNRYHPKGRCVDLNLAIFVKQSDGSYERIEEHQRQYAHSREEITAWLAKAGFESICFYGDKRPKAPTETESRWFVCARKPGRLPQSI